MWNTFSKLLILLGSIFIILGAVGLVIQKTGLGKVMHHSVVKVVVNHLPGDIRIERRNFSFFFPITSCILISIILTLIGSIVMRMRGH